MRLIAIRMRHVRRFGFQGVAIENIPAGLSMLAAPNEFGKTTLFDALRAVLFQKHSAKNVITKGLTAINGTAPVIEVDFVSDGERYRLSKRFLRSPFAELIHLETGQRTKANDEAHDWMINVVGANKAGEGPTGLLWVEQGASMKAPEAGEAGKSLLANLLEHEVGDVTGGERSRRLLMRVQTELAKYVTQHGNPKIGRYKSLLTALEDGKTKIRELEERRSASENLLTELGQVSKAIAFLSAPDHRQRLETELTAAQRVLAAAREAEKLLDTLRNNLGDKSAAVMRCQGDLQLFENQVQQTKELQATLAANESTRAKWAAQSEIAKSALVTAQDHETKSREKRQAAEKVAKLRTRADVEIAAREQSQKLKRTLEEANRVSGECATLIGQRNQNSITAAVLDQFKAAQLEVARHQARLDVMRPTLTPELSPLGQATVRLDGNVIAGVANLTGRQVLSLGELGKLTIAVVDPADAKADLDDATETLAGLFAEHRVETTKQAEERATERRELERKIERLQIRLEQLAPDGLTALQTEYQAACAVLSDDTLSQDDVDQLPDLATAERLREAARDEYDRCRDHREMAEAEHNSVVSELAAVKSALAHGTEQLETLHTQIGLPSEWEQRFAGYKAAYQTAQQAEADLKSKIASKEAAAPSLETAEIDVRRLESAKSTNDKKLSEKRIREAEVKRDLAAISETGPDEELANLQQQQVSLHRQLSGVEAHIAALRLLEKELRRAQESLQEAFLRPVSNELHPLLAMVLPDAKVSLGEDFNADGIVRAGRSEEVEVLSGGTQEQVAVLTRLAFARLMAKRGREMPVILDDALVWCDDSRLEGIFRALHSAAKDIQCLVLTCHERGFSTLGAHHLAVKNWPESE